MPPDTPRAAGTTGSRLVCELLRAGIAVRTTVSGRSMGRGLPPGSSVEVAPIRGRVRVGDVVLIDAPDVGHLLHRVVRRCPGGRIQTRGDACWRLDQAVDEARVVGRVRRVRRPGGAWRAATPGPLAGALAVARLLLSAVAVRLPAGPARAAAGPRRRRRWKPGAA